MRRFGEKIRGKVDYQKWSTVYDLYLEHFESCDRRGLTLLKEIAERAEITVLQKAADGLYFQNHIKGKIMV